MPYEIDETHDPSLESWVESANDPGTDFPIQNLPFCVVAADGLLPTPGVRVGDMVVDLDVLDDAGLLPDGVSTGRVSCTSFATLSSEKRRQLRRRIQELLRKDVPELRDNRLVRSRALLHADDVELWYPVNTGDYTDFYASVHHATNVGTMFRPDNPLMPNYKWLPVGYHGRASTLEVGVRGEAGGVRRPKGQLAPREDGGAPTFEACRMLDYELEVGAFIAGGWEDVGPIGIEKAEDHLFGLCLLNDWSARDIQKWEYQPLGPFLAKNFATSISPYIVTMEALAPFRVPREARPDGDPQPLPHLDSEHDRTRGGFDIHLEVHLASRQMRDRGMAPVRLSKGNFRTMYWTFAQMLTHHASSGCNMRPGDLIGSGTVSGPERSSRGCLLELTWNGGKGDPRPGTDRTPIELPTGEQRKFLEDGDEVILRGSCEREGFRRIGFGECRGIIEPAA